MECPNCAEPMQERQVRCPACGSDVGRDSDDAPTLGREVKPSPILDFMPGHTFADRYTIIERIGSGGMGVVYKAIDTALDNSTVALKLIQPALSRMAEFTNRFRREVRITRQITHPNICRVHDIGMHDEVLFLSMAWIEGETVHQLLRKAGMLKEGRALEIAEKIAAALEAAHAQEIIHRDLKPANVMVGRRGAVYVLDFGLAVDQGDLEEDEREAVVGTPVYMAPEQKRGEPADARSDLYSLGLILLELLSGRRPQAGAPLAGNLPSGINPLIPPLLRRLLAPRRSDRPRSAAHLRTELHALLEHPSISTSTLPDLPAPLSPRQKALRWIGAIALAGMLGAGLYLLLRDDAPPALEPEAQMFYDRGQHYLRESHSIRKIDDAIQFFHRALNVEPESALIMAALSEGNYRRFERSHTTSSREEAERWLHNGEEIDPELPELRSARAHGYIIEGKFEAARNELQQALGDKPELTLAWVQMGEVHQANGDYAEGLAAFRKAQELDPSRFRVLLYFGLFHFHFGEYDEAAGYFRHATELAPDSHTAWINLGACLLHTGQTRQAITVLEQAIAISEEADALSNLGTAHYILGEYDQAEPYYRRAVEASPEDASQWANLGDCLRVLGRDAEAREVYRRAADLARKRVELEPLNADSKIKLALVCAQAGDVDCATSHGAEAVRMQPENTDLVLMYAVTLCIVGNESESLDWLDQAVRLGASRAQINAYPDFDPCRDNDRFRRIVDLAS